MINIVLLLSKVKKIKKDFEKSFSSTPCGPYGDFG